jgi:hypothetical protein
MSKARDWRTLAEDGVDNAYESEKTSGRTKRSADARAAQGRPHAMAGYGYRNEHDHRTGRFTRRVIENDEAVNIAELYDRLHKGHSLKSIERDWHERGIRTRPPQPCEDGCAKKHDRNGGRHVKPGTPGVPFAARYLRQLAMNPAYAGIRVHLTDAERKADRDSMEGTTKGDWAPIDADEPGAEEHPARPGRPPADRLACRQVRSVRWRADGHRPGRHAGVDLLLPAGPRQGERARPGQDRRGRHNGIPVR